MLKLFGLRGVCSGKKLVILRELHVPAYLL